MLRAFDGTDGSDAEIVEGGPQPEAIGLRRIWSHRQKNVGGWPAALTLLGLSSSEPGSEAGIETWSPVSASCNAETVDRVRHLQPKCEGIPVKNRGLRQQQRKIRRVISGNFSIMALNSSLNGVERRLRFLTIARQHVESDLRV